MADEAIHQATAVELLNRAGANLSSPSDPYAAPVDPELAIAQGQTTEIAKQQAAKSLATMTPAEKASQQRQIERLANGDIPQAAAQLDPKAFMEQTANQVAAKQAIEQQQKQAVIDQTPQPMPTHDPRTGRPLPADMITSPADAVVRTADIRDQSMANSRQDERAAVKVLEDQGKLETEIAASEKPYIDSLAKQNKESYDRLQQSTAAVQKQQEERIHQYQNVQDEMSKMAKETPKDLFGQAGVNSVMGAVAIMIGGAGMNGEHSNHALEMINNLADRNVAAQKNRFEMLNRVGQGHQTIYGMLTQKLQSDTAVEAALRNAFGEVVESQLKQVGNQYADKTSKLKVQAGIAELRAARHERDMTAHHAFFSDSMEALKLHDSQEMARMTQAAAAHKMMLEEQRLNLDVGKEVQKEVLRQQHNGFADLNGTVAEGEHGKLAEEWSGGRNMVMQLDEASKLLDADPSAANARAWAALEAINQGDARKYFNTGQRLEGPEMAMMKATGLSVAQFAERMASNQMGDLDISQIKDGYKAIQAFIAQSAFGKIHGGAPHVTWGDPNSVMGRFNPEVFQQQYEREAIKNKGPTGSRDKVKNLPAWGETAKNNAKYKPQKAIPGGY